MPISIGFDPALHLATVSYTGTIKSSDLVGAVDRLYTDARWQAGTATLWDGTAITTLFVAPGEIADLVEAHCRHTDAAAGSRNALLAVRDDDRLISALFITLVRTLPAAYRLFTDRAAALTWLHEGDGLDEGDER